MQKISTKSNNNFLKKKAEDNSERNKAERNKAPAFPSGPPSIFAVLFFLLFVDARLLLALQFNLRVWFG